MQSGNKGGICRLSYSLNVTGYTYILSLYVFLSGMCVLAPPSDQSGSKEKRLCFFHVYCNKNHMLRFPRHVQKLRDSPLGLVSLGFIFLATPFRAMLLFRVFFNSLNCILHIQGCMHLQIGDVV